MGRRNGTYYCRFCMEQRPKDLPACSSCMSKGCSVVSPDAPRATTRAIRLPPVSAGHGNYRCPAGCGRPIEFKWRKSPCFACFKVLEPERAKLLEKKRSARIAAEIAAEKNMVRQRDEARLERQRFAKEAARVSAARADRLKNVWTEFDRDGRLPIQCCYLQCRAAHSGNGFCRSHQPPAAKLKAAVMAAKVVMGWRATQAPRHDVGPPR